jgi:ATP-dependent DNA helicase RecG
LKNLNFINEVLNEKNEVLDEVLNEVLNSGRAEMEIKVIKEILQSPTIRQKELAEEVGASVSTVQRIIKKMVKEGKIVRVNGKRDGYWKVL